MIYGAGYVDKVLSEEEVSALCREALAQQDLAGKRLLFVIPDHSRTAPIDLMFRVLYRLLADQAAAMDFMVALGTHPPMTQEAIYHRVGINREEHGQRYPLARFFNHHWKDRGQLKTIGVLPPEEVMALSNGLLTDSVEVTINKQVFDYDVLIIVGPTFPHEVVGFSGGNKYLFPGIAGPEIIDMFHWLGALITNPMIIGRKYTPVRAVVDRAAAMLPMQRLCFSLVVKGGDLAGLYLGTPAEAWDTAADLSDKLHIVYESRQYQQVLSCAPPMYEDLWTGGKCMYKLEPVVADGGELIIYAPHITEVSVTHGAHIESIGYHVRDYFLRQAGRFKEVPGGVMAHSTHVRGVGSYEDGIEKPRIQVTLATGISREVCEKINLGYRDPSSIDVDAFRHREEEGILLVEKAGEMLYRYRPSEIQ